MKEYNLPDDWKYVSLGDIAEVKNGVSFKPNDVKKKGIRILRSGNIQNGYLVLKNDDTDKVELDSIEQVRELVKKGNRVTILEEKYRAYKQHYNY